MVMGILYNLQKKPAYQVILIGLEDSGKSTLYKLILNTMNLQHKATNISKSCIQLSFVYKERKISLWYLLGGEENRHMWRSYFKWASAVILMVNCSDESIILKNKEIVDTFKRENSLSACKLLVFANKQDIKNAFTVYEVEDMIGLKQLKIVYKIFACETLTGKGVTTGLDWLFFLSD